MLGFPLFLRIHSIDQRHQKEFILDVFKGIECDGEKVAFAFLYNCTMETTRKYASLDADSAYRVISFLDLGVGFVYDSTRFSVERAIQIEGFRALLVQLRCNSTLQTIYAVASVFFDS